MWNERLSPLWRQVDLSRMCLSAAVVRPQLDVIRCVCLVVGWSVSWSQVGFVT